MHSTNGLLHRCEAMSTEASSDLTTRLRNLVSTRAILNCYFLHISRRRQRFTELSAPLSWPGFATFSRLPPRATPGLKTPRGANSGTPCPADCGDSGNPSLERFPLSRRALTLPTKSREPRSSTTRLLRRIRHRQSVFSPQGLFLALLAGASRHFMSAGYITYNCPALAIALPSAKNISSLALSRHQEKI